MRHHPKFVVCLLVSVTLLFVCSGVALSQEITGGIVGSVKDQSGAAVKGATVTVTDPATKHVVRTVMTNDDGAYTARDLHPQTYDVAVEAAGFKKHIASKVQVDVGKSVNLDIGLEVGNVSEVVTVEANPVEPVIAPEIAPDWIWIGPELVGLEKRTAPWAAFIERAFASKEKIEFAPRRARVRSVNSIPARESVPVRTTPSS